MSEDNHTDMGPETSSALDGPGLGLSGGGMNSEEDQSYRVLARKYRPSNFDELIGQEAMVRTLRNAFETGRIAHGFILTGVRGIGKTTTARIIAKGLNCMGPEGTDRLDGAPTVAPCGVCANCVAISESRHVDVLEMDAASRTGIDDIREIIEGVRYAPVSARFKVYIIDEVHMLSRAAFNGLLKTLEEPPPHVKFIFATTEIRKVPVTVLSRCQRFDLRRIEGEQMMAHLGSVATAEGVAIDSGALNLLARAAEGSARDALSLLDQAISHGAEEKISEAAVRDMLGLVDRGRIFDLFEHLMQGDIATSLEELRALYVAGGDPISILQDLLEVTHWVTRLKVSGTGTTEAIATEDELKRGREFSERLQMNVLTRTWSMLLKGLGEVQTAPQAMSAAEMILIRLAYMADLPAPDELVRALSKSHESASSGPSNPSAASPTSATGGATSQQRSVSSPMQDTPPNNQPQAIGTNGGHVTAVAPSAEPATEQHHYVFGSFDAIVDEAAERREIVLKTQLEDFVHLVRFEPGRVDLRLAEKAPPDLPGRLSSILQEWTGERWIVSVSKEAGAATLSEQKADLERRRQEAASQDPMVAALLDVFPEGRIAKIRDLSETRGAGLTDTGEELHHDPYAEDDDL